MLFSLDKLLHEVDATPVWQAICIADRMISGMPELFLPRHLPRPLGPSPKGRGPRGCARRKRTPSGQPPNSHKGPVSPPKKPKESKNRNCVLPQKMPRISPEDSQGFTSNPQRNSGSHHVGGANPVGCSVSHGSQRSGQYLLVYFPKVGQ
jgi:hypothetical protein